MSHMTTGYSHKITVIFATHNLFMVCKAGGNFKSLKNLHKHAMQTEKYALI